MLEPSRTVRSSTAPAVITSFLPLGGKWAAQLHRICGKKGQYTVVVSGIEHIYPRFQPRFHYHDTAYHCKAQNPLTSTRVHTGHVILQMLPDPVHVSTEVPAFPVPV